MTKFFVPPRPNSDRDDETLFADLAKSCGVDLPDPSERIESITWLDERMEVWTATVGEPLRGERVDQVGRGDRAREVTVRLSDDAVVQAIFPGDVRYWVVTNVFRGNGVRSAWENPTEALTDSIRSIVRFDPE